MKVSPEAGQFARRIGGDTLGITAWRRDADLLTRRRLPEPLATGRRIAFAGWEILSPATYRAYRITRFANMHPLSKAAYVAGSIVIDQVAFLAYTFTGPFSLPVKIFVLNPLTHAALEPVEAELKRRLRDAEFQGENEDQSTRR